MLYVCQDCKRIFYEPNKRRVDCGWDTEYGRNSAWQTESTCPFCGSEDYVDAEECCECMGVFPEHEMMLTDNCDYICSECYSKMEENEE